MKIVERADSPPSKCAVSGFSDGPFVDTEARLGAVDPHIYINVEVAKQIGALLGMVPEEHAQELYGQIAGLEDQITQLSHELDEAQAFVKAIDVLESGDFKVRKAA